MRGQHNFDKTPFSNRLGPLVKVVEWSNDDRNEKIYQVPRETLNFLKRYLKEGYVGEEVRDGLAKALLRCPLWAEIALVDLETTQRQAIVGILVTTTFEEIEVDCEVSVPTN